MPDRNDYVIPREGGAVLTYGTGAAGSIPATMNTIGCPRSANFNRSVNQVDDNFSNWCVAQDAGGTIAGFTPGTVQYEGSVVYEMILDEAAYLAMKTDVGVNYAWIGRTLSDVDAANTTNESWGGYLTGFNEQLPESGPASVSANFRANEIIIP